MGGQAPGQSFMGDMGNVYHTHGAITRTGIHVPFGGRWGWRGRLFIYIGDFGEHSESREP